MSGSRARSPQRLRVGFRDGGSCGLGWWASVMASLEGPSGMLAWDIHEPLSASARGRRPPCTPSRLSHTSTIIVLSLVLTCRVQVPA